MPISEVLQETVSTCVPSFVVMSVIGVPFSSLIVNLLLSHEIFISVHVLQSKVKVLLLGLPKATVGNFNVPPSTIDGLISSLRVTRTLRICLLPVAPVYVTKRIYFAVSGISHFKLYQVSVLPKSIVIARVQLLLSVKYSA